MKCHWHALTNILDGWFSTYLVALTITSVLILISQQHLRSDVRQLRESSAGASLKKTAWPNKVSPLNAFPTDRELGYLGYFWVVRLRYVALIGIILALFYPSISPTFCENRQCKGQVGLKSKTICIPDVNQVTRASAVPVRII